jgi:uncharacterized membrane protein
MSRKFDGRRPRPRIEGLADLVFGLSLSLGSLSLVISLPSSVSELDNHILAFVFTFFFLITVWISYTGSMSVLPAETTLVLGLNIILLLLVAIVPFLLNVVGLGNPSLTAAENNVIRNHASTLFAIDLSGLWLVLAFFYHILGQEKAKLVAQDLLRIYRNRRNMMFILVGIMLVSTAPIFSTYTILGYPARFYIWYAPIIIFWVRRLTNFRW